MKTSLLNIEIAGYVNNQINNFYPDNNVIPKTELLKFIDITLERINYCFKHVSLPHYYENNEVIFNHLYSDHYVVFLWFLSNSIYREWGKCVLADKIYYLNKTLHGLDCMYDTKLPDIFLLFHSSGTMLGKAVYSDYFVALHGCTVGSYNGIYPKLGKGVSLTANSSIIGNCEIGDRVSISTGTILVNKSISSDMVVINGTNDRYIIKSAINSYSQQFFNVDLKSL